MDPNQDIKDPAGPPDADVVSQIQDHIALLCSRFFNFIGALQRDAPPVPLHAEPIADQKQEELQVRISGYFSTLHAHPWRFLLTTMLCQINAETNSYNARGSY